MTRYSRSVSIARHSASLRTTSNSAADALRARTLAASAVERNDRRFMAVSLLQDRAPLTRPRPDPLVSAAEAPCPSHESHRSTGWCPWSTHGPDCRLVPRYGGSTPSLEPKARSLTKG